MSQEYFEIATRNNRRIAVSKFSPQQSNAKSIVITSATGVLQKYYAKFAIHFASLGFTVYTFDYSGIGKSQSHAIKQNTCNLQDWAIDQGLVLEYAKTINPNHNIILITHSIGGQLIGLNPKIKLANAIITVCSQSGYWKLFKGFNRFKMYVFWHIIIPAATPLFGYFPAKTLGLFENLPKRAAYQWRSWGISPNYMLSQFNSSELYFKNVTCNVLALSFPRDWYAPKQAVDWLANQFTNATVDRQHIIPEDLNIEDVQHFGFFRAKYSDSLWVMTNQWIEKYT